MTTSASLREIEEALVWNLTSVAVGALIVYEHLLTFRREVETIWQRRVGVVSVALLINRYTTLVMGIEDIAAAIMQPNYARCFATSVLNDVCFVALTILFGFFTALRAYATWDRKFILLIAVFILCIVPVATNLYVYPHLSLRALTGIGCFQFPNLPRYTEKRLGLATRISAILVDLAVLFLTWLKLSRSLNWKDVRGHGIGNTLLRNGCFYFIAMLLLNSAEIAVIQLTEQTYVTGFITATTSILISRFIMDLRSVGSSTTLPTVTRTRGSAHNDASSGVLSYLSELGEDLTQDLPSEGNSWGRISG